MNSRNSIIPIGCPPSFELRLHQVVSGCFGGDGEAEAFVEPAGRIDFQDLQGNG